ncbi:MAG TPA: hypothetical protein VE575_03600 [Acidimicrobiales bacterium]|nr:hypothetical protein [Acidimicrobiales bacterium]
MTIDRSAAREFIYANGRLLEQLVYEALFEDGAPERVVQAVAAYQNDDGGFGHGLEPDKRAPASQPLDVDAALERLVSVGAQAPDVVTRACDFLAGIAEPSGAVPVLLPSIAGYPRAPHWAENDDYAPSLLPTASIAGYVHALGVEHEWAERATAYAFSVLEAGDVPPEAHTLLFTTRFLEHAADRDRAEALAGVVTRALPGAAWFQDKPDAHNYGVTPLDFAPGPDGLARPWFEDATIAEHLDHLERQQGDDGGWPVLWEPPSDASRCEWRAIRTFAALRVLTAYGRNAA